MKLLLLLSITTVLLVCGCLVPSLHPLFTDKDITVRPELSGDWISEEDGGALWLFQLEPDSSYSLAYVENSDTSWFVVHLVNLRDRLFMDMYPDPNDALSDEYKVHLIAAHTFSKIDFDSGNITISILDADWLRSRLDSGKLNLAHELLGPGDLVLTASTLELQKFMSSIVDDTDALAPFHLLPFKHPTDSL